MVPDEQRLVNHQIVGKDFLAARVTIESEVEELMNPYDATPDSQFTALAAGNAERVSAFLRRVYGWMALGLAVTALVAFSVAASPAAMAALLQNRLLFYGLIIGELALVVFLSARVLKMSAAAAMASFLLYSALNGVTLSIVLLAFTMTSVATTFLITAGMFGTLALIGTVTKANLAGIGSFALMGLWGVILASIVGIFVHSSGLQFVISIVGVIVFTCLTAWDAQKLKSLALATAEGHAENLAIRGALAVYLDFINLFLILLRFLGNRRS
jgi:FtsH-binding integral membrane protein